MLAAGPSLVNRWEAAPDPYSKALITAALDARRVGIHAPLTGEILATAVPGYLTPVQQADAPSDWLPAAFAYATTQVHGAAAPLATVAAGMGRIAGYTVADYLYQHAVKLRRTTPLPDAVWQALVDHHHPYDARRLAENAERRGHPRYAETLYHCAIDVGDLHAVVQLSDLLIKQGRVEEAIAVMRPYADVGVRFVAARLAGLLDKQGHVEELRQRADAGDGEAARQLTGLLARQGRLDEAITVARPYADAGNGQSAAQLAGLLLKQGRVEELRERADAGDQHAAAELAVLLAEQGHVEEAIRILQGYADAGSGHAAARLADLLVGQGRVDDLRLRADAGDRCAADCLAAVLAQQGRVEELGQLADAGHEYAAVQLACHLANQGRDDEAIALLCEYTNADSPGAAFLLSSLLAKKGRIEELRRLADTGDEFAAVQLTGLLADEEHAGELALEVAAGTIGAVDRQATLAAGIESKALAVRLQPRGKGSSVHR